MLTGSGEGSQVEEQSNSVETERLGIQAEQANPCPPVEPEIEVEPKVVVEKEVEQKATVEKAEWSYLLIDC